MSRENEYWFDKALTEDEVNAYAEFWKTDRQRVPAIPGMTQLTISVTEKLSEALRGIS